ncbi:hypothetical protein OF83DRAFT_1060183 [Amylostereum chailletii]|nr:hypothetical protein OF83DRAFT_1060183 [Amylostereum chailletii]
MDFTPKQPAPEVRACDRCDAEAGPEVPFTFFNGVEGQSGRRVCPRCAEHYRERQDRERQSGVGTVSGCIAFTAVSSEPTGAELQRFSSTSLSGLLPGVPMGPPSALPAGFRNVSSSHYGQLSPRSRVSSSVPSGYNANHVVYKNYREQMAAAAASQQPRVMISVALHRLKGEGIGGSSLVGNIERDIKVPLHISAHDLHQVVVETILPDRNVWAMHFPFDIRTLSLFKLPRLLLHPDPMQDPGRPVLEEFFLKMRGKGPVAQLNTSAKVKVLLIMTFEAHDEIQVWRENKLHVSAGLFGEEAGNVVSDTQVSTHRRNVVETTAKVCDPLLPLRAAPFEEVVQSSHPFQTEDFDSTRLITLVVESHRSTHDMSMGRFKTCHAAKVTLASNSSALDLPPILTCSSIVAKRLYWRDEKATASGDFQPRPKRQCYAVKDDLELMLTESNCLFWGAGLMSHLYNNLDRIVKEKKALGEDIIRFPRLRFVKAGLAITQTGPVYLLEEKIEGEFVKYIGNGNAKPSPGISKAEAYIAEFLCFAQHFQYEDTGRTVYLSDFQGLTSSFILHTREYVDKFAEGNYTPAFNMFESQHECNAFCNFFSLLPYHSTGAVHTPEGLAQSAAHARLTSHGMVPSVSVQALNSLHDQSVGRK